MTDPWTQYEPGARLWDQRRFAPLARSKPPAVLSVIAGTLCFVGVVLVVLAIRV